MPRLRTTTVATARGVLMAERAAAGYSHQVRHEPDRVTWGDWDILKTETTIPDLPTARRDMVRRQLRTLLWFYAAAVVIILIVGLVSRENKTIFLSALNIAAWLGFFFLLRADRLQSTGLLICFVLLGTATYTTWSTPNGLLDSTTTLFAVIAVFAALLLNRRLVLFVLFVTVADIFIIGFRSRLGLFAQEESAEIIVMDPVIVSIVVGILALVVRRQQNHQWRALEKALIQEKALQQQAEQLQASERRWRTLVQAAPEWIMQIDREAVISFTNREDLPGHEGDLGRPLADLLEPACRTAVKEAMCEVLAGRQPPPLDVDMTLNGDIRHCVMNLGPLEGPGGVTNAIVLVSDVTDRRQLQLQLEQVQRLESLGRLAGGIAHDFNNLLTVISGHADLARVGAGATGDPADDLEAIRAACDRAADLTGQILAFGRFQPQRSRPLQLNDTVESLIPMLRSLLGDDVALTVDLEAGLPPVVGDPGQLEQVVVNLVINARDAVREAARQVPPSDIADAERHITVRTRQLEVGDEESVPAADWIDEPLGVSGVVLVVEDTGSGMDESTRRRAFEPFYSTKPMGEGSGLGLAMVYGIVKQNNGAIRIESAPGAGTTVFVALPARPDESVEADPGAADTRTADAGSGEHILLVEDDDYVRKLMSRMLTNLGYRVVECTDVDEALAAAGRHADLKAVVTDITMPGGSGFELAKKLPRHLSVLFTSGYASDTSQEAVGRIPEGCFLQKPFTFEELAEAVRSVLGRGNP